MAKYCVFWKNCDLFQIVENMDQQITINFQEIPNDKGTFLTTVYTKCSTFEMIDLWDSLNDYE